VCVGFTVGAGHGQCHVGLAVGLLVVGAGHGQCHGVGLAVGLFVARAYVSPKKKHTMDEIVFDLVMKYATDNIPATNSPGPHLSPSSNLGAGWEEALQGSWWGAG
jgi:hypothetical protein